MKLCRKNYLLDLIKEEKIKIGNVENIEKNFLDDIRFGLSLRNTLLEIKEPIDLNNPKQVAFEKHELENVEIDKGKFYLAASKETLTLPNNILGVIYTRSKYARVGFELAKSSTIIVPGFGRAESAPIVFEITTPLNLKNLKCDKFYTFVLFYELDEEVEIKKGNYSKKFPLLEF